MKVFIILATAAAFCNSKAPLAAHFTCEECLDPASLQYEKVLFPNMSVYWDKNVSIPTCMYPINATSVNCSDACFEVSMYTSPPFADKDKFKHLYEHSARGCWGDQYNVSEFRVPHVKGCYNHTVTHLPGENGEQAPLILQWCFCADNLCNNNPTRPNLNETTTGTDGTDETTVPTTSATVTPSAPPFEPVFCVGLYTIVIFILLLILILLIALLSIILGLKRKK